MHNTNTDDKEKALAPNAGGGDVEFERFADVARRLGSISAIEKTLNLGDRAVRYRVEFGR